MYQVIQMHGDYEPWWFLEGWEEDITASKQFERYEDALAYYHKEWLRLSNRLPEKKIKEGVMTAFWSPDEKRWCEECDEYLQLYHSLMLLENQSSLFETSVKKTSGPRLRPCQIK